MKDTLEVLHRFANRFGYGISVTDIGQVMIYNTLTYEVMAISGNFHQEEILMVATLLLEEVIDMQAGKEEDMEERCSTTDH